MATIGTYIARTRAQDTHPKQTEDTGKTRSTEQLALKPVVVKYGRSLGGTGSPCGSQHQAGPSKAFPNCLRAKGCRMFRRSTFTRISLFRSLCMGLTTIGVFTLVSMFLAPQAYSHQPQISWSADSSSVAGYKVYYGPSSGNYTSNVDVGNNTTYTFQSLSAPAYIALTAYNSSNVQSAYSQELVVEGLTASAGSGGSISPAGNFFVAQGTNQTFTITPASGYKVSSVLVDGASAGAVTSYTLSNISAGHTVSATFAASTPTSYTITASAGSNGSISPSGSVAVNSGATQAFTIAAATGYKISSVLVDGASVGAVASYTFSSVAANHTISATFAASTTSYTISASAGSNGSISPSGSVAVNSGATQAFTIAAATGYKVSSVLVDGASVGAVTSYTFSSVTANHTISATFAASTTSYTITASAGSNGSISPSGSVAVKSGAAQAFTIAPAAGYKISSVLVDGASVGAVASYTFSSVAANHTISATFAASTASSYTISASAGSNGSISPSGSVAVKSGATQAFMITPATGCQVSYVLVDGTSVGSVSSYTFTNTAANHTISATFASKHRRLGSSTSSDAVNSAASQATAITPTGSQVSSSAPVEGFVADAGPEQTVASGAAVTLSGSNSTDTGGPGIASYLWTQVAGTPVSLSKPSTATATFTAPQVQAGEALTFQLTVTDKNGLKTTGACIVNVTSGSGAPSAQAGADQTVSELTIVTLNGSESTDPDNAIASYAWQQVDGPVAALSNANSAQPTFVAPLSTTGYASLSFKLTVTNISGLKSTDTCFVNVTSDSAAPKVVVGPAKTTNAGNTVKLSGSGSADSGAKIASLQWRQTTGVPVTLSKPASATPSFIAKKAGRYDNTSTFDLIVKDTNGLRSKARQVITVK